MSHFTCHMLHVTCHMSGVLCHQFIFYMVVEPVVGGSVINGAYPIYFFTASAHWADSVIELPCPSVCMCVCLFVCAIGCSFLLGLSLTLRSHDEFQACHWSIPPPPKKKSWKKEEKNNKKKNWIPLPKLFFGFLKVFS